MTRSGWQVEWYGERMVSAAAKRPLGPDPTRARSAVTALGDLRSLVGEAEDEVLACLVVTGEPRPQRVLDDWLDQVADTLRAIGEQAADLSPTLARFADAAPARDDLPDAAAADAPPVDAEGRS